ncbi:hypothetical protein [Streptomyces sp. CB01373]|uniref:hypothetical protein n=1 Tax=Streptomyces sp. CB01373 TaxID=2020325 RepID=UPI000C271FCE|nr:hypothetical protein [Streptomyces sp. CB01373]PJM95259.1 hypothetical protein CG719_12205 [Streptomyces sp. CB01373]
MQIKPRRHLLDIWQAVSRHSIESGEWGWGEWGGLSSAAGAERLLCLMVPATEIAAFWLDDPDIIGSDVRTALKDVGGRTEIPAKPVLILAVFMGTYTAEDERPSFAGGHSIQDLFSERPLTFDLLTREQQRLAEVLRLRWEITQRNWSGIVRFGDVGPLEDSLWRTTGQSMESVYFSLPAVSIPFHDLLRRRATDEDLTRTVAVKERLAERSRISSRMTEDDTAIVLHAPGVRLVLQDAGRWDDVQAVYPNAPATERPPSWSFTERVVECMVADPRLCGRPPLHSIELVGSVSSLPSDATHLLGKELLEPTSGPDTSLSLAPLSVEAGLARAREVLNRQPGTTMELILRVLAELDSLVRARRDASRGE